MYAYMQVYRCIHVYVIRRAHVYVYMYTVHVHVGVADTGKHDLFECDISLLPVIRFERSRYQMKAKNIAFLMVYKLF